MKHTQTAATYTIGAAHDAYGTEGQRTHKGAAPDAIAAAKQIAAEAGHGWRPYVFDGSGNPVEMPDAEVQP